MAAERNCCPECDFGGIERGSTRVSRHAVTEEHQRGSHLGDPAAAAGEDPQLRREDVAAERPPQPPPRTRTSAAFKVLVAGLVVLVLLLVFILENTQSVKVSYFGATGHISLGVALLLAAVAGALLAALIGGGRILQVRRHVKRARR